MQFCDSIFTVVNHVNTQKSITIKDFNFFLVFLFSIQNGPGPTHPLPNLFWMFGFFFNFVTFLRHDKKTEQKQKYATSI